MLWIGEVEDAGSIHGLITCASLTRKPIPDFENLDFKIASGLTKTFTGTSKKQVHSQRKNSIREAITCGQTNCLDDLRALQNEWRH